MKKLIVLALVASSVLLTGCEEETKSTDWYAEHPDETFIVYSKCLKSGSDSQNCKNAKRGASYLSAATEDERFKKLFPSAPIPTFK